MIRSTDKLLRRVDRLRIRCAALIDGKLIGSYDSTFKGEGVEFEETRPYQSGDDVRAIDWRVTARFSKPFVKLFRQQRQLTLHLLVDGSGSMRVPAPARNPADLAAEVVAILSLVASTEQDRVGMMLFTDTVEHSVPPQNGLSHVSRLIRDLVCWQPTGRGTRLDLPLQRLHRTERGRSIVVLISDFLTLGDQRPLRVISAAHDLIPVIVRHSSEEHLPPCGMLRVRDPETGRMRWIDTLQAKQRQQFDQTARLQRSRLDQMFAKLGCLPLHLRPNDDVVTALHRYFDQKRPAAMNPEDINKLLKRLFQTDQGLREIDGQLSVPWTATQWLLCVTLCALGAIAMLRIYRYFQRRWTKRQPTFASLLRELDGIDQSRLRRQLEHDEVILEIANVLRVALRLVDQQRGGSGGYRTTGQWTNWSKRHLPAPQQQLLQEVLELADGLKFANGGISLSEVRGATTAARELIAIWRAAPPAGTGLEPAREDAA